MLRIAQRIAYCKQIDHHFRNKTAGGFCELALKLEISNDRLMRLYCYMIRHYMIKTTYSTKHSSLIYTHEGNIKEKLGINLQ